MDGDDVAAEDELVPGETYDVFVLAQMAEHYPVTALSLVDVELREGSRVVALGRVTGPVFESAPPSVIGKIKSAR